MIYFELTRLATEETCEVGFFFKLSPHCFARLLVFFTNPGGGAFFKFYRISFQGKFAYILQRYVKFMSLIS